MSYGGAGFDSSTHVERLRLACNFSSGVSETLLALCRHLHQLNTYRCLIKTKINVSLPTLTPPFKAPGSGNYFGYKEANTSDSVYLVPYYAEITR